MSDVKAYAGIARAPFLLLPVTLVICGAGAALAEGTFDWRRSLLALVALVAAHIGVNALNEYSDMRRGIDLKTERTPFSGGSGTLPSGAATTGTALTIGLGAAGVALGIGVWFLWNLGWSFLPFILVGGLFVLGYTDALARIGLGEIAAGLGLGSLAVAGVAFVQEGSLGPVAIAASVPSFFMTFNLLLLNEFPDVEADREGGRKNLIIIWGRKPAAWIYAIAALQVPAFIIGAVIAGPFGLWALLGVLPSILLLQPLLWVFTDPEAPVPIPALGSNVIWNLATNTLLGIGLMLGVWL
jgi:1,4-dihydroxy-2-naphthoate octaprenyltransferase